MEKQWSAAVDGNVLVWHSLHTAGAREIWIDQSGFSRREKFYCPDVKLTSQERHWNQATFLTGDGIKYPWKRDLHFQKPYQFAKSEKYEPFCVSKLLFWRQKWVAGAQHGNSLVVRRVSPGRIIVIIVMLFGTKYAVPRQIKPGILKLTTSRGQSNLRNVFIFC